MKRLSLKRLLAIFLCLCCLGALLPAFAEEVDYMKGCDPVFSSIDSFTSAEYPLYVKDEEHQSTIRLFFVNDELGIPYVSLGEVCELYNQANEIYSYDMEGMELELSYSQGNGYLTRENGSEACVFPESDTIYYADYNRFHASHNAVQSLDLVATYKKDGKTYLIDHKAVIERSGDTVTFDLSLYNIDIFYRDGEVYLPLQTANDVFFAIIGYRVMWNRKAVFAGDSTVLGNASQDGTVTLQTLFEDAEPTASSPALQQFNYNELCFFLDHFYGLKEEHVITNFADLFTETGLNKLIKDEEPLRSFQALSKLTLTYFADKHSSVSTRSPLGGVTKTGNLAYLSFITDMAMMAEFADVMADYASKRASYYPNGVPGYEEVGNTAYITFDQFIIDAEKDYYTAEITNTTQDTITLLLYANQQLHRANCPIENVVIDLTNNIGGKMDAAVCVVAWFLGNSDMYITNTQNHALACTRYLFDANLDHVFNQSLDNVTQYRRFCLISPNSFSCGNLVPAAFAASDEVFQIGRKSGGGTCAVLACNDALGNTFSISSPYCINSNVNGTYLNVDEGIVPDLTISNISHLYDRAYLTELINSLP